MSLRICGLPPWKRLPNSLPRYSAMCSATSMPTSSTRVAAPTGKPNFLVTESSSLTVTPSYASPTQTCTFEEGGEAINLFKRPRSERLPTRSNDAQNSKILCLYPAFIVCILQADTSKKKGMQLNPREIQSDLLQWALKRSRVNPT
uniref:Uncharacterized protein n=1 Tax=Rhipicephalus zambeziensis TaxID=60191 RepID=A0A224Y666_9ACAR